MYDVYAVLISAGCYGFVDPAPPRPGAGLMTAANAFGLIVAIAIFAYLVYALFRGERL